MKTYLNEKTIKIVNMSTLTHLLFYPVASLKRRFGGGNKAFVDDIAPPVSVISECKYGEYCIKSEVTTRDMNGQIDETFIGYSGDMNITTKTKYACERFKNRNTICDDPTMVIMGGECKDVIFVKNRAGMIRELSGI